METYSFIVIMASGYVHQVRITGKDWDEIKELEMQLVKTMMEIDFWKQINHTMLLKIDTEQDAPKFSIDYDAFLEEIRSMRAL